MRGESEYDRLLRKADQEDEMAGMARCDGDLADSVRRNREAANLRERARRLREGGL